MLVGETKTKSKHTNKRSITSKHTQVDNLNPDWNLFVFAHSVILLSHSHTRAHSFNHQHKQISHARTRKQCEMTVPQGDNARTITTSRQQQQQQQQQRQQTSREPEEDEEEEEQKNERDKRAPRVNERDRTLSGSVCFCEGVCV